MKRVFRSNSEVVQAFREGNGEARAGSIFAEGDTLYSYGHHFPLALRLSELYLINADKYSITTSAHQALAIHFLVPNVQVPFSALRGAGISPERVKIRHYTIDTWETENYIDPETGERKTREVHYLGMVLFSHNRKHYLSGFDNQESLRRRNYFLTQLSKPAENVKAAIEGLKPQDVREAEKQGRNIKRQGEWFFIEYPELETRNLGLFMGRMTAWGKNVTHIATEVRRDGNRIYVRGTARHRPEGRQPQHGVLKLGQTWHKVVKNTALQSWQALGLVD